MEIEHLPTKQLTEMGAKYNPRKISDHDLESLRRSLREFGTVEPIIVNRRTGRIVGGHQRVKAADAEGIEELPVVYVDLDETAEKQLNLALNRISGEFDRDMLQVLLHEIEDGGGSLDLTGFDSGELQNLFLEIEEGEQDPYSEWEGMPEFSNTEDCYRRLIVNFEDEAAVKSFEEKIGEELGETTKSIRYPKREWRKTREKRWADGDGEEEHAGEEPEAVSPVPAVHD